MKDEAMREALAAAWRRFLDAIERGDAPALADGVTEQVSMFLPFPNAPDAVHGRAEVVARFQRAFDSLRAAGSAARLIEIRVERFDCRPLADDVWLVESLLSFGQERGKRTVIYGREGDRWRIIHLHGSNRRAAQPQRPPALG